MGRPGRGCAAFSFSVLWSDSAQSWGHWLVHRSERGGWDSWSLRRSQKHPCDDQWTLVCPPPPADPPVRRLCWGSPRKSLNRKSWWGQIAPWVWSPYPKIPNNMEADEKNLSKKFPKIAANKQTSKDTYRPHWIWCRLSIKNKTTRHWHNAKPYDTLHITQFLLADGSGVVGAFF